MVLRFKILLLLAKCYLKSLTKGKTTQDVSDPKNFAVINLTGNVGDMVCTTPVFHAIKKQYPNSKVVVVGAKKNRFTTLGSPDIDVYIDNEKGTDDVIEQLQKEDIDYACCINVSPVEVATMILGGAKKVVAFDIKGESLNQTALYNLFKSLIVTVPYYPGQYVPREYLRVLEPFGIETDDIRKHLAYTDEAMETVLGQLKEKGIDPKTEKILAVSPGAGTKVKQWPADRFAQLANHASKKYDMPIAIIGGPKDIEETNTLIENFDDTVRYYNFADQSLEELKATLSLVKVIAANDSGPVYFAESFGASTFVLVGPTNEAEHPLRDRLHRVVLPPDRGDALLSSMVSNESQVDHDEARAQILAITPGQAIEEFDDLMKEL